MNAEAAAARPVDGTVFDATTALVADGPGRYGIELDPAWSSLRGIHGGYLAAIAIGAAETVDPDRTVRTVTTTFLRPAVAGPAAITVEPVRRGRSISNLAITISQGARDVAVSHITAMAVTDGVAWDHAARLDLVPIEQCVPLAPPPGIGHFDHGDAVLDPADLPFSHGAHARVAGYLRPVEARPIDAAWLGMALDWFPPASFTYVDPPTGGTSIVFTIHLHHTLEGLAADAWLGAEFHADISADGIALEKGVIADPSGRILAESFHTRWTALTAPSFATVIESDRSGDRGVDP